MTKAKDGHTIGSILIVAFAVMVILAIPTTIWVVSSHFEAATFTKLTGKEATTWDAMWVNLRVMGD